MPESSSLEATAVLTETSDPIVQEIDCTVAREQCMPSFVFSVAGQVGFRSALSHLATCQKMPCKSLRASVFKTMHIKMKWLMKEECLLGCVHIQPTLYGSKKIVMTKKAFPVVVKHLARCPKESCAQLRRSVLLDVRDELRPN